VTTELVVLQHHAGHGPSAFTEVLDARTSLAPWRLVDLAAGQPLPAAEDLAGVISLGGPGGLDDETTPDWLQPERELLRTAAEREVPVLGIGLGAHVLATALGGQVVRRDTPLVGYRPLSRTEAAGSEPVAAGWPDGTAALLLSTERVAALPGEAEVVLGDEDDPAAWRRGSALGVTFRPEATLEQLEQWVADGELDELLTDDDQAKALLDEAGRRARFTVPQGKALIGRFLDDPVRKHLAD
jgi:GMP synthase (glutamine-hydrolysing)